ncbi:MAG: LysM peptidoglycan-binding domain-containing protein [Candidatus Wallbacteria bacterium]|nr:LysM peptidoglycan-binding domain-containing protein [Candidatus Wallbacteria bacterium]
MKQLILFFMVSGLLLHVFAEDLTYRIQTGDTLSGLSLKYTGTVNNYKAIAEYNKISNPDKIIAGKEILIPGDILNEEIAATEDNTTEKMNPSTNQALAGKDQKTNPLSEEKLDSLSSEIMNKIEKMRDERKKHYQMRESIGMVKAGEAIRVEEDKPVTLEVSAGRDLETIEKDRNSSDYIIKLNSSEVFTDEAKPANHQDRHNWVLGGRYNIQHHPSGDSIVDLKRTGFAEASLRYRTHGENWLGVQGGEWHQSNSADQKLEYDRIGLVYRYFFDRDVKSDSAWFAEAGLSYYYTYYWFWTGGVYNKVTDNSTGFDLGVGYEKNLNRDLSYELFIKGQVAQARFTELNPELSESLNDIYTGIGLNYNF